MKTHYIVNNSSTKIKRIHLIGTLLIAIFFINNCYSQGGIKGVAKNAKGKPVAYSTLYIKEIKSGTIANENGYFEFVLPNGEYTVDFRCLGYQSITKKVIINNSFTTVNINFEEQPLELKTVTIFANKEDPAYTIMRKAIAASNYYKILVKSYSANLYIKGFGEIKVPKIIYKFGKKEGIDTVEYLTSESNNKIKYEYPNKYEQIVISARTNDKDSSQSSIYNYINSSIYDDRFGGGVSPLSASAFSFYRFKLINTFTEKGEKISKIQVIPRSKGNKVFSGDIYIVNNLWCVYAFDLKTITQGIEMQINQTYTNVNDKIWMPINQQYDVKFSFFGVNISWKYLAVLSDYKVDINESLDIKKLTLIDEKVEKEYAKALEEEQKLKNKKSEVNSDTIKEIIEEKELTLKDFKRKMKELEKESEKKQSEPEIISDYTMTIDSMAFKKNVQFWDSIRPIPLNENEQKRSFSFKNDSINELKKSDTAKSSIFGKTFSNFLFGKKYIINENWSLRYKSILSTLYFNTVEGYNIGVPLQLTYSKKDKNTVKFSTNFHYGFDSKALSIDGGLQYYFKNNQEGKQYIKLNGGRLISQINSNNPISQFNNSITTLFQRKNYLKLYQKDFVEIALKTQFCNKLKINSNISWSQRTPLYNISNYSYIDSKNKTYSPNAPENIELNNTDFLKHKAFIVSIKLDYYPIVKYYKRNGVKMPIYKFPLLSFEYNGGYKDVLGSNVDFNRIEVSFQHKFEGIRRTFDFKIFGGNTFENKPLSFIDYKHFNGNKYILNFNDPMNKYSLLDYYNYSTNSPYIGLNSKIEFRKLLLTQLFWLNFAGVKESFSFNYLKTEKSPHYFEIGYGLENIMKILKIETFISVENGIQKQFGLRVGLSLGSSVSINFDE